MQPASDGAQNVQDFVLQCRTRLQKILQKLDWTEEGVLENFNSNSVASITSKKPKKSCPPKISKYPESCIATNSISIETPQLQQLLQNDQIEAPQNFRDLQSKFSREQKLIIYEHVINHTEKLENNTVVKVAEGETSFADIVAQKKREEKQKKRKFRKSKPTHIEEVRSLVDLQMQALLQYMGNQKDKVKEQEWKNGKDSSYSQRRSQSRDRHRNKERTVESQRWKRPPSKERSNNRRRSRSRRYERTKGSRKRSRSRSKERTKNSKGRSYDHRKRSRSKERKNDFHRKSNTSKEAGNNHRNRSRSRSHNRSRHYENYHRRQSKSPKTGAKYDQSKDRHQNGKSSHKQKTYDNDYKEDRKKYNQKSKRRSTSREREHVYPKDSKTKEYKESEKNQYYQKRSEDIDDISRSRHKSKKHKRDCS